MTEILEQLLTEARARRSLPEPELRRLLRQRAGLSQEQVAEVLGVNRVAVSRYESGQRTPRGTVQLQYVQLLQRLGDEIAAH